MHAVLTYTDHLRSTHREEAIYDAEDCAPPHKVTRDREKLFFNKRGWCPFCKRFTSRVHLFGHEAERFRYDPARLAQRISHDWSKGAYEDKSCVVWHCSCGWWELLEHDSYASEIGSRSQTILLHGVLKLFDVASHDVPISSLRRHLSKNPAAMHFTDPKVFERLIASVFRDHMDCDVLHCGRSGDGGIDLFAIDADQPIAIQVKRRANPKTKESVSLIREFLGALILYDKRFRVSRGMIVTSAADFTRGAQEASIRAVTTNAVTEMRLVKATDLIHMFKLTSIKEEEPWTKHVQHYHRIKSPGSPYE